MPRLRVRRTLDRKGDGEDRARDLRQGRGFHFPLRHVQGMMADMEWQGEAKSTCGLSPPLVYELRTPSEDAPDCEESFDDYVAKIKLWIAQRSPVRAEKAVVGGPPPWRHPEQPNQDASKVPPIQQPRRFGLGYPLPGQTIWTGCQAEGEARGELRQRGLGGKCTKCVVGPLAPPNVPVTASDDRGCGRVSPAPRVPPATRPSPLGPGEAGKRVSQGRRLAHPWDSSRLVLVLFPCFVPPVVVPLSLPPSLSEVEVATNIATILSWRVNRDAGSIKVQENRARLAASRGFCMRPREIRQTQ